MEERLSAKEMISIAGKRYWEKTRGEKGRLLLVAVMMGVIGMGMWFGIVFGNPIITDRLRMTENASGDTAVVRNGHVETINDEGVTLVSTESSTNPAGIAMLTVTTALLVVPFVIFLLLLRREGQAKLEFIDLKLEEVRRGH